MTRESRKRTSVDEDFTKHSSDPEPATESSENGPPLQFAGNVPAGTTVEIELSETDPETELQVKPCETEAQPKTNKKFITEKFEVLHVTDNKQEQPTYIVRNLENNDFSICREVNEEKYLHYLLVKNQLNKFRTVISDEDQVDEKVWPRDTKLLKSVTDKKFYIVSLRHYGTLHSYVIDKKKLSETECRLIFYQILQIVAFCHERGIVLRDIKLRKFVFTDDQCVHIRLDNVDEVMICDTLDNDLINDRHGCPAYVSPEILDLSNKGYSGKAADVWSLGVLLYVMLMGRYPFYDQTPSGLFEKIRSDKVPLNEQCGLSLEVRLLIKSFLRKLPHERPTVHDILPYPWFFGAEMVRSPPNVSVPLKHSCKDQNVP